MAVFIIRTLIRRILSNHKPSLIQLRLRKASVINHSWLLESEYFVVRVVQIPRIARIDEGLRLIDPVQNVVGEGLCPRRIDPGDRVCQPYSLQARLLPARNPT